MSRPDDTQAAARLFDGRYRIIRTLGRGGMAKVYLAEDESLHRKVAIKILADRYAEDDQFVERFQREARAAAGLNHPNIVQIYDRGEAEGTYYIAMEYLEGETLKDLIDREGPLPARRAVDLTLQILAALRFSHRNGIIHRDVKPHNIMVLRDGRVKVTDFGIARAGVSEMTEAGSIIGTAQYLSPEQARGLPVGPAADLYSVGIVLYEMLTGRVPFEGDSAVAIAMQHVQQPPQPPSRLNPNVPAALEQVVLHALEKDPARRYGSADELGMDLDRVRKGLAPTGGAGLLVDGTVAGQTIVVPRTGGRAPVPPEPVEPRRRGRVWPWLLLLALLVAAAALGLAAWNGTQDDGSTKPEPSSGSTRAAQIAVPDLRGRPLREARALLTARGFIVGGPVRRFSDRPQGEVIDQSPQPNAMLDPKATVTLTVSRGPEQVEVPDVSRRTRADAEAAVRQARLTATFTERASEDVPEGNVISQDPAGGTKVAPGGTVAIVISTGVPKARVPNIQPGFGEAVARRRIEAAGLRVGEVTQQQSEAIAEGHVVSISPGPGSEVPRGSAVSIVLSSGSGEATVPAVVGQNGDEARATLQGQGFKVTVASRPVTDPAQDALVVDQTPPGESSAPEGSTVTIFVGSTSATGETTGD